MGEISEDVIDGIMCESCGAYLGEGTGSPQRCDTCAVDDDLKAGFKDMKDTSKAKRASHRETSPEILQREGISFYSNNGGVHLICTYNHKKFTLQADLWPGTGRFQIRGDAGMGAPRGTKGFGVFNLVKLLKGAKKNG